MSFDYEESYEIRKALEPARSYLWRVVLPDIREPVSRIAQSRAMQWANSNALPRFSIDMKDMNLRVSEINTPFFSIETQKVTEGATFWYSVRQNDISNVSLTLEEDEEGSTYRYINAWKNMIVNPNGTYNPPAFWKKDIYMYRLNLMKMDFQVAIYRGYFPSELAAISNTYEDSDILKYNLNLTGDSVDVVNIDSSGGFIDLLDSTSQSTYDQLKKRLLDVEIPNSTVFENIVSDALEGIGRNLLRKII